ncbi:MAG: T9SS type A sorting domain-containing protein, partial [Ginsengibacter sp.]
AAGFSGSNGGNVSGNHGNNDYWVVKLDIMGSLQWQKSLGGSGDDQAFPIQNCADGGFIVAGYGGSNDGDETGNHGGFDLWVVRLSSAGNIEWQKSLGGTGSEDARSLQQTADGGYVVFGSSGTVGGDVTENQGNLDYWIVKLAAFGLPLRILRFDAVKTNTIVQLSWQTTNEINTSHFIVQRSGNGINFTDIGKIGARNVSGNNDYSLTDASPVNGDNFYRLKMVDVDGKTSYSKIIKIVFTGKNELQAFPNPAKNSITLSGLQNKGTIKIIATDGKVVKQIAVTANSMMVDISALNKGIFILQYNDEGKVQRLKIIKE